MYPRLTNILNSNSFFLFGARATGKSSLLEAAFQEQKCIWINFLDDDQFLAFSKNSKLLEEKLKTFVHDNKRTPDWIVLDEVQRVPKILNEVHRLLESREYRGKIKFALTGSSARKLKRSGANMLGGRALINRLFPLTFIELDKDFNLDTALDWGTLPGVYTSSNDDVRSGMLRSYVTTYITEEIREEQVIRQIDPFLRFLEVAAQHNGEIINNSEIGRDCQVEPKTVARYFQILEDTLLGFFLPSFDLSIRKQQRKAAKFYFFDLGVVKAIRGTLTVPTAPSTYGYGKYFESFVINEIHRLNSYYLSDFKLSYIRTKTSAEVDLVIRKPDGSITLVEIKSSRAVSTLHAQKLQKFLESIPKASAIILSLDPEYRRIGHVDVYPWQDGIRRIFER
jgi:predicted AAA+ superfamily ATPase